MDIDHIAEQISSLTVEDGGGHLLEDDATIFMNNTHNRIDSAVFVSDLYNLKRTTHLPPIEFGNEVTLYDSVISLCQLLSVSGYNITTPYEFPEFVYFPIHKTLKRFAKIAIGRCNLSAFLILMHEFYINTCVSIDDIPDDETDDADTRAYYAMIRAFITSGKIIHFVDLLDTTLYINTITQYGVLVLGK